MNTAQLDISTPQGQAEALLLHGVMPADMHGISADELEAVYAQAYEDIQAERYDAALEHAALLVRLDPGEHRYQFAFALCLHHLGDHEAAGRHYAQALLLDATNAFCTFRAGECLVALGHLADAREAFEATVKLSYLHTEYADVRALAEQQLDALAQAGA